MNTTIRKSWKSSLYLDALGSASVIAASVFIFLFVAVTAITEATSPPTQVVDACPVNRFSAVDDTDQRPGAPRQPARTECV